MAARDRHITRCADVFWTTAATVKVQLERRRFQRRHSFSDGYALHAPEQLLQRQRSSGVSSVHASIGLLSAILSRTLAAAERIDAQGRAHPHAISTMH
eukprot:4954515-Pleurochrysis_carterae.AAC.1